MKKEKLIEIGEWAQERVDSGQEPPWTFHKLKSLAELAFEFAEGIDKSFAFTPGIETDDGLNAEISGDNVIRLQTPARPQESNLPA